MQLQAQKPAWRAPAGQAAAWLGTRFPGTIAVLAHGCVAAEDAVPGATLELLHVGRLALDPAQQKVAQRALARRLTGWPFTLQTIAGHRLGWLPPSVFQQSLVHSAILLWGDDAALRAIPSWPPERLDPRLALDEIEFARAAAPNRPALAIHQAIGALLIARRALVFSAQGRRQRLREVWPEVQDVQLDDGSPATRFVDRAARLMRDWLFTWERTGPPPLAIERYTAMWRQANMVSPAEART